MLAILSNGHHGTTASSSSRSANPISNPAHPENTVNVPVGTPAPRSAMVSGPSFALHAQSATSPRLPRRALRVSSGRAESCLVHAGLGGRSKRTQGDFGGRSQSGVPQRGRYDQQRLTGLPNIRPWLRLRTSERGAISSSPCRDAPLAEERESGLCDPMRTAPKRLCSPMQKGTNTG